MTLNKPYTVRIFPAGEQALIVKAGDDISESTNEKIRRLSLCIDLALGRPASETASATTSETVSETVSQAPRILDLIPSYNELMVQFDPKEQDARALKRWLQHLLGQTETISLPEAREWEIPMVYGGEYGPDLQEVARHSRLSEKEVIALHSAGVYRVYMLGFLPGFCYLGGLDPRLACPRKSTPRPHIAAGSVGIAGQQTGIYPLDSPGGWQIIGRSPFRPFDPRRTDPFLINPGDSLRFVPEKTFRGVSFSADSSGESLENEKPGVWVEEPGLLSLVQDEGRYGYQRYGMPVSGAMDLDAYRRANQLLGNTQGEAALEITLKGPRLRWEIDTVIALCGADLGPRINEKRTEMNQALRVKTGDVLHFQGGKGGRTYLAVAQGIDVPLVMGSRSCCLPAGIGGYKGRALKKGDRLPLKALTDFPHTDIGFTARESRTTPDEPVWLNLIPGPEISRFGLDALKNLLASEYRISAQSNRMGYRLEGAPINVKPGEKSEIISAGIAPGTLQIPPDGQPILLMADRQTTGGYARMAILASADISLAARLLPGQKIRFREQPPPAPED